ncbi:hypothetical protein PPYR_02110 [Photinus pyralis]|uniref:Uncharacterized protein n=2 Tax=Photinus pyralis TaxID=7054 RepID=A0A5N4B704_PHOPY|nr:hypothetical protein PPYR_02110 [Photinus pyralis]
MREMGKFMYELNKIQPHLKSLRDMLDPKYYDDIVNVINHIAGLDERTGKYRAPSTAYNLGLHIKSISLLLEAECIKEQNTAKREAVKDLLCLINEGFTTDINKTVGENQCESKRRKKIVLPTAEDILALKTFLTRGLEEAYNSLLIEYTPKCWRDLAGLTLTSLQLFNRRRAGELERIELSDYKTFEYVNENDDSLQQLDASVKAVARNYGRFFIRGKLNRAVPVILSRQLVSYTDMIVKYREAYGVPKENPYVFGIPGRTHFTHLSACVLIRRYAKACGAPNPHTLRGTELRKQIATACSLYNLSDPLVEDMANHLGHHIDIHKKIYRQSIGREVPNIVNILLKTLGEGEVEEDTEEDSRAFVGNQNNGDSSPILLDDTHYYDTFGDNSNPIHTTNMTISTPSNILNNFDNCAPIDTISMKNATVSAPSNVASHFDDNFEPIHTTKKKNTTISTPSNTLHLSSIDTISKKNATVSAPSNVASHFDDNFEPIHTTKKKNTTISTPSNTLHLSSIDTISKKNATVSRPSNDASYDSINTSMSKRTSWSNEEKQAVNEQFDHMIQFGVVPTYKECMELKEQYPCLEKRTPPQIKSYVVYQTKKKETVGHCSQFKRVRWTTPERNLVFSEFKSYLEQKNLPSLRKCSEVISKHPILSSRTPEVLKAYINNQNKKKN